MKLKPRPMFVPLCVVALWASAASLIAQPVGQWDFDAGNLSAAAGTALEYLDGPGGATQQATAFGTTTTFGISGIAGVEAKVMKYGSNTAPQGFRMNVAAGPNGGGNFVNQWTLIFDVLFPASTQGQWHSFIEVDNGFIAADAEFFVNPTGGIGVSGRYDGFIDVNTWYRVGFVVDTSVDEIRKYINGRLVGVQSATSGATLALDGRWALDPSVGAQLFNDDGSDTSEGYVNSVQLRDQALTGGQMLALAGPTASGIPQVIPPIPSSLVSWVPRAATANRTTDLAVIIDVADTTIADNSISFKLDGSLLANPSINRDGVLLTISKPNPGAFGIGSDHVLEVTYTDSLAGAKTFTKPFKAAVFFEDFDEVTLGPKVDEGEAGEAVWTETPPEGWTVDDTGIPGYEDVSTDGVTEWAGWSFANASWWTRTAGNQLRETFVRGTGNVAIADPDEWDDKSHTKGLYNAYMSTPSISLEGAAPNSLFMKFDSSWRPECCDDAGDLDNDQTAVITASYDGGAEIEVLRWQSSEGSPFFHPDAPNEGITVSLKNPAGAKQLVVKFGLILAENDWWWAFDNLVINAGVLPPTITQEPGLTTALVGQLLQVSVTAAGGQPLTYQWFKDFGGVKTAIPGATSAELTFSQIALSDAGIYNVRISNAGGVANGADFRIVVLEPFGGIVTQDLVVHLKFDGDASDSSSRGNNGSEVGTVAYVPGRIGQALSYSSLKDGSSFNFVTLGAPDDLNFGDGTDFSVSFWTKFTQWTGDPAFISNKNWGGGGNQGWVVATADNGGLQWNIGPSRADYDGPGGTLANTNWHHVVVTFDRDGLISTYLDGTQVNVTANGAVRNVDTPSGQATNIGQDGLGTYTDGASVGIEDGLIDDVGIWRRTLTRAEVQAIYSAALSDKDLSEASVPPATSKDLVVYLPFENNLLDASGRGNSGTAVGTIGYVPGRIGTALSYSSKKDSTSFNYVTLGKAADLNFSTNQSFSASFWAKLESWEGDPVFLGNKDCGSGNNPGWVIATGSDGRIQWNLGGTPTAANGNRRDFDSAGGVFSDRGWHHIVVVNERLSGAGFSHTYVDGVRINTVSYSGADNQLDSLGNRSTNIGQDGLGTYVDSNDVEVNGVIDEIGIWRRKLSDAEVFGLYAAGLQSVPLSSSSSALALGLPPGKLALSRSADRTTIQLIWSANAGVRLQRATSLSSPLWQDVPATLAIGQYTLAVDPAATDYFDSFDPDRTRARAQFR